MIDQPAMTTFRFHWRDGKISEGAGYDVAHAFSRLGYGGGAIRALDYYETVASPVDIGEKHEF